MHQITSKLIRGRDRLAILIEGKVSATPILQAVISANMSVKCFQTAKEARDWVDKFTAHEAKLPVTAMQKPGSFTIHTVTYKDGKEVISPTPIADDTDLSSARMAQNSTALDISWKYKSWQRLRETFRKLQASSS